MAKDDNEKPAFDIPGYKIGRRLGRGGMAEVYLAVQESIGRNVAIKIMLPQLLTDTTFSERFIREAKISAKLAHPNIVPIFDVGVTSDSHYITMGYLPGGDLKQRIEKGISLSETIKVMKEICAALDFAAKMDCVHRDIKPENILFSQTGAAVLSDFGIARSAVDGATSLTQTGSVIGTPHYMSPEQAQGKKIDGRADLYSMGIVFYQMLTGELPYEGDSALSIGIKHIRDPIPELPAEFSKYKNFLEKLVAKNPADRWQTGADVVRTLEVLDAGGKIEGDVTAQRTMVSGQTQVVDTGSQPVQKKSSRLMLGLAGIAVLGVAFGGYLYTQGQSGAASNPAQMSNAVHNKVQALLTAAVDDMAASRYVEPKGENAAEKFRSVLLLDNTSKAANRGLQQISDIYARKAEDLIGQHKNAQAKVELKTASEVFPGNPRLVALNKRLYPASSPRTQTAARPVRTKTAILTPKEQKIENKRLQAEKDNLLREQKLEKRRLQAEKDNPRKIKAYLAKADLYLVPKKLSRKGLENAIKYYHAAHRLSPEDSAVRALLARIEKGYQIEAEKLRGENELKDVRTLTTRGAKLLKGNQFLLDMKARATADYAASKKKK